MPPGRSHKGANGISAQQPAPRTPIEMNPTIVIAAYNRPGALSRLLASIARAVYPSEGGVHLHISIDRGDNQEVRKVAECFEWEHGQKHVVYHPEHLGLLQHFYCCGDLTKDYGAIILLEDDLLVSPMFYAYARQAFGYYGDDERLAGVSLYSLWFNGYTHHPFVPLSDDSDVFFLQIPYTQGQAFNRSQWEQFTAWHALGDWRVVPGDPLHEMFLSFDEEDWFPIRTKYLVKTGRYYVFPRESLATGFGDAGTHFSKTSYFFQVPLQYSKQDYRFKEFDRSVAVYDSFFEILPERLDRLTGLFKGYRYDVDLHGTKSSSHLMANQEAEYVLTSRGCKSPLFSFGKAMWPVEANLIEDVPGSEISFGKKEDLDWSRLADLAIKQSSSAYYTRHRPFDKKLQLQFLLLRLAQKLNSSLKGR